MTKPGIESPNDFYLGRFCDEKTGDATEQVLLYDSRNLTTHGVVVGMTGSGKTGLCLTIMEEAAIDGIPAILVDPKGDMSNLLLAFPGQSQDEFVDWVNPEDAKRAGMSVEAFAAKTAADWKKGVADWDQDGERIQRLKDSAEFRIYTPGSDTGLAISIVQNFDAPPAGTNSEAIRSKAAATSSAILGLVGIGGDPLRSREHILLSNIFVFCWSKGEAVPLEKLITYIQEPPIRKLGVFDVDSFFAKQDRQELAFSVNNILASPTFQGWIQGESFDIARLIKTPEGKPRQLIFSISHLSDEQRMFFVTLLMEQIIFWMRGQQGSTGLRMLVYFDEVFGYLPPHPANPASKEPILTLLKQGRAFGVGMILATQNPVDLDYKSLSNAGTWFVGKLQTERDKARLLDGLEGAASAQGSLSDRSTLDKTISSLSNRKFLYHNIHEGKPQLMMTRWALCYLRGPLDQTQIGKLMAPYRIAAKDESATAQEGQREDESTESSVQDDSFKTDLKQKSASRGFDSKLSTAAPVVHDEISQYYLPTSKTVDQAKVELGVAGAKPLACNIVYVPKIIGVGIVRFSDRKRSIDEKRDYLLLADPPAEGQLADWPSAEQLKTGDLTNRPDAEQAAWQDLPVNANEPKEIKQFFKDFERYLYNNAFLALMTNSELDLKSELEESQEDFLKRCQEIAKQHCEEEGAALKADLEAKLDALDQKKRKTEQQLTEKEAELSSRRRTEIFSFGETILNFMLGKRNLRSVSTISSKRGQTEKARLDADEAKSNLERYTDQEKELQKEFEDAAAELTEKWDSIAKGISEEKITPRKTDVSVTRFGICWTPHWNIPLPSRSTGLIEAYRKPKE